MEFLASSASERSDPRGGQAAGAGNGDGDDAEATSQLPPKPVEEDEEEDDDDLELFGLSFAGLDPSAIIDGRVLLGRRRRGGRRRGARRPPPPTAERVAIGSLDGEAFATRFSRPGKPVVLTGAEAYAPIHLTLDDHWRTHHGERCLPLEVNSPRAVTDVPLERFLRFGDPSLRALYLRNLHVGDWFPDEV